MPADPCNAKPGHAPMTLDDVHAKIRSSIEPIGGYQQIILKQCLGRVLAEDITAPADIPREQHSSMDGYAFNSRDLEPEGVTRLKIAGTSWAGRHYAGPLAKGECARIFTGAMVPVNADSVAIQEEIVRDGQYIDLAPQIRTRDNIRMPGDEIRQGQQVLCKGKRLAPADIGILASLGISTVTVQRRIRIAFFSTGDELIGLDQLPQPGQLYDSNRYSLFAMLQTLGVEAFDMGVVGDDQQAILDALTEASEMADAILTSGGVSVGDADLVKTALQSAGTIDFWKIAIKPGKPLAFGTIGDALFFGLPGNPVSVFVTFYQVVRPAIMQMMGIAWKPGLRLTARCDSDIAKTAGRQEFQRASFYLSPQGEPRVKPAAKQLSHQLSAVSQSNCFIVLAAECEGVQAGSLVNVELIDPAFHFL